VDNTITKEVAIDYHNCALGKWRYTGEGKNLPQKLLTELDEVHMLVHKTIGEAIDFKTNGDMLNAYNKLKDLETYSSNIVDILTKLEPEYDKLAHISCGDACNHKH
jgi:hypothetical protein